MNAAKVMRVLLAALLALASISAFGDTVFRPYSIRYQANLNGDIAQIGNNNMSCLVGTNSTDAGGFSCASVQAGGNPGRNNGFNSVDIDVDADATTFNSSNATLNMPPGSVVRFAGLYWGARADANLGSRGTVLLRTPATLGYASVFASQVDDCSSSNSGCYAAFADVTALVQAGGAGTYWTANIQNTNAPALTNNEWAGWALVVVYESNTQPVRNLVVFDGLVLVNTAAGSVVNVSGFLTPLSGPVVTRVGTAGYDGDQGGAGGTTGDALAVASSTNPSFTTISDAANPADNFYNSTIADGGVVVTTRSPAHVNTLGMDSDRFTLPNGVVGNGATSASIRLNTGGEFYYNHIVTFATELYVPIITPNLVKTVTDLNGGAILPGDILRWTVSMTNSGYDTAINLVLVDPIPANTTYVANSLRIVTGPGPTGAMIDAVAGDQADFRGTGTVADPFRVVFRLGSGAGGGNLANDLLNGGNLAFGQSTSISFDAVVGAVPAGTLLTNTASISYSGQTLSSTSFAASSSAVGASVLGAPTIAKSFSPAAIAIGGSSVLTLVLGNPAGNPQALTGGTVTDNYPPNSVRNATPANPNVVCTPGSSLALADVTAVNNTTSVAVGGAGASIAPGGTCTITVNVIDNSAGAGGVFTNITGAVSATNAGSGATASAVISIGRARIVKTFVNAVREVGQTTTMRFSITNPTGAGITLPNGAFTDSWSVSGPGFTAPNGVGIAVVAPLAGSACPGTTTIVTGNNLTYNGGGGALAAGATCNIEIIVTAVAVSGNGSANTNQVSNLTTSLGASAPSNVAPLTVVAAPAVAKSFSPAVVNLNDVTTLSITLSNAANGPLNGNSTVARSGAAGAAAVFCDTFPANLIHTTPRNVTVNCSAGSSATLTTSGATCNALTQDRLGLDALVLAPGGSCTITAAVLPNAAGNKTNPAFAVTFDDAPDPTSAATVLTVTTNNEPTVTKDFRNAADLASVSVLPIGTTSRLRITITNPNVAAVTGLRFNDVYPAGLVNTAAAAPATTCTLVNASIAAANGGGSVGVNLTAGSPAPGDGLTIPGSGSCTVSVNVTSNAAGLYFNTTGAMSSQNAPPTLATTDSITFLAPPVVTKFFNPTGVGINVNSTLTIRIANNPANSAAVTGITFTDTYPGLLVNATPANRSVFCTSGSALALADVTAADGGGSIAVGGAGATAAVGGYCDVTVQVRSGTGGNYTNPSAPVTVNTTNAGTTTLGSATLSVGKLTVAKSFSPATINVGQNSTVTFTITNPLVGAVTGLTFSDTLENMQIASSAVGGTCTGIVSTAAAGVTDFRVTAGNVPAAGSCTVTIQVTSTTPGSLPNRTTQAGRGQNDPAFPPVGAAHGGDAVPGAPSNNAILNVVPPPTGIKSFNPAAVATGVNSQMTIQLLNVNNFSITNVGYTDVFPVGLLYQSTVSNTCGGTLTDSAGGALGAGDVGIRLSGGTIPLNSTCAVVVNVSAAVTGAYTNTIAAGAVTSDFGYNLSPLAATLNVLSPPVVTKAFAPAAIALNGNSLMTITLTNPNAQAITLASPAFTDTYPANLDNSGSAAEATTCPGSTVSIVSSPGAGTDSISLSGGSIPANGSCTVTVNVTSGTAGNYINPAFTVTPTNAGTATSNAAALAVGVASITKVFSPNPMVSGATSTLTFTIVNPTNAAIALGNPAFVDTFPVAPGAMTVAAPLTTTNSCGGTLVDSGNAALTAGDLGIRLNNGSVPANGSCTITVNVTATVAGVYNNTTTALSPGGSVATAPITVMAAPTVTKSFNAAVVGVNLPSVLTLRLSNSNAFPITGAAFTDAYPASLENYASPGASSTCGGTLTAVPGAPSVSLSGGTIPANGFCEVSVSVTSAVAAQYLNNLPIGALTTSNAGSNTAASNNATLSVMAPLVVTKTYATNPVVGAGGTSVMRIDIQNPNAFAGINVTNVALNDVYPAGLVNAAAPAGGIAVLAGGGPCTGTVSAVGNDNGVVLSGATIGPSTTCRLSVTVTSSVAGAYANFTGPVTTDNAGSHPGAAGTIVFNASVAANTAPTMTKRFRNAADTADIDEIPAGGTSLLRIEITNPAANPAIVNAGIVFTDTFPAGMTVSAAAGTPLTACGGAATLTDTGGGGVGAGDTGVRLNNASIAAGATCIVRVVVTATVPGDYVNNSSGAVFTNAPPAGGASDTLTVMAPPLITKTYATNPVAAATDTVMTLTFTNPNSRAITGLAFTDNFPAGMTIGTVGGGQPTNSCGGNITNPAGGALAITNTGIRLGSVTTGTIPANSSCTVTANVRHNNNAGNFVNTLGTGGSLVTTTNTGAPADATGTLSGLTAPLPVSLTKSFDFPSGLYAPARLVFTLRKNAPAGTTATAIGFTDVFPTGMTVAAPVTTSNNCPTAGTLNDSGGGGLGAGDVGVQLTGAAFNAADAAGTTCQITVEVATNNVGGDFNNVTTAVLSTIGGTATTGANAAATLSLLPVQLSKSFNPSAVDIGQTSSLTFTIANPNAFGVNNLAFTDVLPANLFIDTPNGLVNGCGGTVTATAGTQTITFTGGSVVAGGSCAISVGVLANRDGSFNNTSTQVTGASGTGTAATATLVAAVPVAHPTITKSFTADTISQGGVSIVTFVITNTRGVPINAVAFSDTLTNMTIVNPPAPTAVGCGGIAISAPHGGSTISVSGGTVAALAGITPGTCTITVRVTSNVINQTPGHPNSTTGVSYNVGGPTLTGNASNVAYLKVNPLTVAINGYVYIDTNKNGSKEATEDWTGGTPVYANLVQGGVVVQTQAVTAVNGFYQFPAVGLGSYAIVLSDGPTNPLPAAPAGWFFTAPTGGIWNITVGGVPLPPQNFGLIGAGLSRISGRVFRDIGTGGGIANDGIFTAGESAPVPGIAGVTVRLTDCGATVYATTTTDANGAYALVAPLGATTLCVVETNATGFLSTGASVGATALPSGTLTPVSGTNYTYCRASTDAGCGANPVDSIRFTNVVGTDYANLNFGDVPVNTLQPDGQQNALPGTTVNYAHTFLAGSGGSVSFSTINTATPANPGWTNAIYRDTNCTGVLDPAEPVLNAAIAVAAGTTICVIVRQFVPANAQSGAQNRATLTAAFSYTNASPALSVSITRNDITIVGPGSGGPLNLRKEARNCGTFANHLVNCPTPGTGAPVYGISSTAAGGEVIEYRITYTNLSAETLTSVVINDVTPPFTTFVNALAGALPPNLTACTKTTPQGTTTCATVQPTGGTGEIDWSFTGTLQSTSSGTVSFKVLVQP